MISEISNATDGTHPINKEAPWAQVEDMSAVQLLWGDKWEKELDLNANKHGR